MFVAVVKIVKTAIVVIMKTTEMPVAVVGDVKNRTTKERIYQRIGSISIKKEEENYVFIYI